MSGVLALTLTGCGGSFGVEGTMTLLDGVTEYAPGGGECDGYGGYDDITPGAQVIISAEGETVGKGELGDGIYEDGWCVFPFSVTEISGGSDFYTVEISGRGGLEYTQAELEEGVELSIGS